MVKIEVRKLTLMKGSLRMLKKRIMVFGHADRYSLHIDPLRSMATTSGTFDLEEFPIMQRGVDALAQACATDPPDLVIIYASFEDIGFPLALMRMANQKKLRFGLFWNRKREVLGPDYLFEYCKFHFRTDVTGQEFCTEVMQILSDKK